MRRPPRQTRRKKRYGLLSPLQHHHLLLRMESKTSPGPSDIQHEKHRIIRLVRDLGMKALDTPRVYYMNTPAWNKGLTAIVPIQTSHIAYHFWSTPDTAILHHPESKCLLELDIYTCGALPHDVVPILMNELTPFTPTHLDCTVFNRKYKLLKELEVHWDASQQTWESWLDTFSDNNV